MKKYGKYEKRPEAAATSQSKVKSGLLQTYFVSLVCMVLCVTMFFGTSYAWFTSEVNNAGNEIYIGILDVELLKQTGVDTWASLSEKVNGVNTTILFDKVDQNNKTIRWEPGYTALETVKVVNQGDLAFKYVLNFTDGTVDGQIDDTLQSIAGWFDVWVYSAGTDATKIPAPQNYSEIAESDDESGWIMVGTLAEMLAGKPVFDGAMDDEDVAQTGENAVAHYYTIALHMKGEHVATAEERAALNAVMGKKIGLNVKLVATQMGSEQDSFGNAGYDDFLFVTTTYELQKAIENAKPGDQIFVAPGTYELTEALVLPSGITLYGAQAGKAAKDWVNAPGAEKTVIKSTGSNVLVISQTSEDPEEATANITIDGIMIDCADCTGEKINGISVSKTDGEAMEGIKIVNCAVVNSGNNGMDVCNTYGAVIENNYVGNVKDTAIHLGNYNGYHYETWAEVTAYVRNNVIENVTASGNGAIQIQNGMGDVVVSGNVIRNVTAAGSEGSSIVKASAINVYDVYEGGEILIDSNTIENADQGISIYKYTYNTVMGESWWAGPTSDNDIVIVSNNTISGFKTFGIATTSLNHKNNTANATLVKITGNTLTSTTSNNPISTDGTGVVTKSENTFNAINID